jgi:phospholipid/cholesterol/gamma-HCH transport system substrate-binding protein
MPQRNQLMWTELRVGIFVLVGIVLVVLGIFYITGTNALGPRYHLVTFLPEVEGLAIGAPVTLDGVQVGNVDTISVAKQRPGQTPDPEHSVAVALRINKAYEQYIRTDSYATLFTEGFLGNRVVSIQRGYTGQVLREGQEVPGLQEKTIRDVVASGNDLMQNLSKLSNQIGTVVSGVQKGQGSLGKLVTDQTLYDRLNNVLARADQITASVQQGQGTMGKLINSDALYNKVDSAAGRADDVLAAVQEQKGSLGKLVYDPSFHDSAKQFLTNGNSFLADLREGRGTLGKLATDDTFFTEWRQTGQNLKEATANLNSKDNTAGKLFSDPKLYDNMTNLTGDMRSLIGDFRTNPKKFLHVKFSLF